MAISKPEELTVGLYERGAVAYASSEDKFWQLKSKRMSPVYVNLRGLPSLSESLPMDITKQRELRDSVVESYSELIDSVERKGDHILGIPHALTALSGLIGYYRSGSVLSMREGEMKHHGAHKVIEGDFQEGDVVIPLDDVVTDGTSKLETIKAIEAEGLVVNDLVVLVDREEGGKQNVEQAGYNLSAAIGLGAMTYILRDQGRIGYKEVQWMEDYYLGLIRDGIIAELPTGLYRGHE